MDPNAVLFAALFVAAFIVGVRSSRRLTKRYRDVAPRLLPTDRLILRSIVIAAWTITIAAGWFGGLAVRALFGFERLAWAPPVGVLLSTAVLFLPKLLDYAVEKVATADPQARPRR